MVIQGSKWEVIKGVQGCHLSSISKFPDFSDFSLTFYSFPYLLTFKNCFYSLLNGANCITSNLGITFKGKNLLLMGANSFL